MGSTSAASVFLFMAIQLDAELLELKAQAEGLKPFRPNALFEKLGEKVCTPRWSWRRRRVPKSYRARRAARGPVSLNP